MRAFVLTAASALSILATQPALAQTAAPAPAQAKKPAARPAARCCLVSSGTLVMIELAEPISTKTQKTGDTFDIRLAEPMVAHGRIVAPVGAKGTGVVIEATKPGLGGKPAKLVLAAQSITVHGHHVRLKALQLSGAGKGQGAVASAAGLTGIAFAPLGFAALAIRGGDVTFTAGTQATAKVASGLTLASLGPAPRGYEPVKSADEDSQGSIALPAPSAGKGLVVFFRSKSLMGTGQWFNVREDGKALGKLSNGAYFVQETDPGVHTYTASLEPEFKDKLKLQIDAGETYFVQGDLAKGVVISAAVLGPSDRVAFNKASKTLKLADAPGADKDEAAQKQAAAQNTQDAAKTPDQQKATDAPAASSGAPSGG